MTKTRGPSDVMSQNSQNNQLTASIPPLIFCNMSPISSPLLQKFEWAKFVTPTERTNVRRNHCNRYRGEPREVIFMHKGCEITMRHDGSPVPGHYTGTWTGWLHSPSRREGHSFHTEKRLLTEAKRIARIHATDLWRKEQGLKKFKANQFKTKITLPELNGPNDMLASARDVIARFGGLKQLVDALAAVGLPRERTVVYKWTYPYPTGSGGKIPRHAWPDIQIAAKRAKVSLDGVRMLPRKKYGK